MLRYGPPYVKPALLGRVRDALSDNHLTTKSVPLMEKIARNGLPS
jgi:hypothetical protein